MFCTGVQGSYEYNQYSLKIGGLSRIRRKLIILQYESD